MIYPLNYLGILTAIDKAISLPGFKVHVYVRSDLNLSDTWHEFMECIIKNRNAYIRFKDSAYSEKTHVLKFMNGSVVKIVRFSEAARGTRSNLILYGTGITDEKVKSILKNCLVKYNLLEQKEI